MTLAQFIRRHGKSHLPILWSQLSRARRIVLNQRPATRVFSSIHAKNRWDGTSSVSGPGSTLEQTVTVRSVLPTLLRRHGVTTLLDLPCGDLNWIRQVDLQGANYMGADIVADIVARNQAANSGLGRFETLDLASCQLPEMDLLLCRDCLVHLPFHMIHQCVANIARSGLRLLWTTTYVNVEENIDVEIGGWRPINLQRSPFNFPAPLEIHLETEAPDGGQGKSMGLWRVADLRSPSHGPA